MSTFFAIIFKSLYFFYYTTYRGTMEYSSPIYIKFCIFTGYTQGVYQQITDYRFRLISSSRSVSEVVITREFAWKPLCVVIISVNSELKSTLDISS